MKYELIFNEEADREITEGYRWYEKRQFRLGESFLGEVEKYISIIKRDPTLYAIRHNNKRVAVLRQFPYIIVYELISQQIVVYAVFNTNQNPRKWKERP